MAQWAQDPQDLFPLLELSLTGRAIVKMSLQTSGWSRCELILQVILKDAGGDVDALVFLRLSGRHPPRCPLPKGLRDGDLL
jgi:hypothetical protein